MLKVHVLDYDVQYHNDLDWLYAVLTVNKPSRPDNIQWHQKVITGTRPKGPTRYASILYVPNHPRSITYIMYAKDIG